MFYEFEFFMPNDFFELSNELYSNMDNFNSGISSIKRTIYSRLYYSTFLFVREWLMRNLNYVSTIKDHTSIPEFIRLKGPFDPIKNGEIATKFEHLKKLRQQADYYIRKNDSMMYGSIWVDGSIEEAFGMAENIIQSFSNMNQYKSI